jgi:secreted trypsin-like serine protease
MLARLTDILPTSDADVEPLAIATGEITDAWVGSTAQLAGLGQSESGSVGTIAFVSEPIVEVDAASIIVDGQGRSGSCHGDSGGPLLIAGVDGNAQVAGVLSIGEASCTGHDSYVRVDVVRRWIGEQINASATGCDTTD